MLKIPFTYGGGCFDGFFGCLAWYKRAIANEWVGFRGAHEGRAILYIGVGLVFAILLALYFLYQAGLEIVLVFLLTLLFSIIISAPVDYLVRKGLKRGWATLIVLSSLALVFMLAVLTLAPMVAEQTRQLVAALPRLLESTQELAGELESALGLNVDLRPEAQELWDSARNYLSGNMVSTAVGVDTGVTNILSMGAIVLITAAYIVARPTPLITGFVALFPAGRRQQVREILSEIYKSVQRWLLGQLAYTAIIGSLFTVTWFAIGIPFALLLGILSGLLTFIPILGPFISVIPPVLLTFVDDPIKALWVVLLYLAIQSIESHVIHPLVMSQAVSLHPALIIFAIMIMGTLFEFIGILLAIPLVAALYVLVHELWTKRMDEKGTDPNPPPKEEPSSTKWEPADRLRRAAETVFRRS
ncbi:MAG: AI-2E family transporter [Rubrobacter sp.]|nr:AI-2E family transporter [Rubrobacter sp.]